MHRQNRSTDPGPERLSSLPRRAEKQGWSRVRNSSAGRLALLVGTSLGLLAVTAAPAAAGLVLTNHCEPS